MSRFSKDARFQLDLEPEVDAARDINRLVRKIDHLFPTAETPVAWAEEGESLCPTVALSTSTNKPAILSFTHVLLRFVFSSSLLLVQQSNLLELSRPDPVWALYTYVFLSSVLSKMLRSLARVRPQTNHRRLHRGGEGETGRRLPATAAAPAAVPVPAAGTGCRTSVRKNCLPMASCRAMGRTRTLAGLVAAVPVVVPVAAAAGGGSSSAGRGVPVM